MFVKYWAKIKVLLSLHYKPKIFFVENEILRYLKKNKILTNEMKS